MRRVALALATVLLVGAAAKADVFGTGANQFTIDFVAISGATNPQSGYGIVNNDYRMGTFEITNDQWNKFKTSLGVPVMGTPSIGYDENPYWTAANVPTNRASWYEAAQFVNWLNTSTGHQAAYKFTGTQGMGGYALAVWSAAEADNGTNLYRHKDAIYYLPTEHEWVKAAYWNGTALQAYSNASLGDLVSGAPDPAKWNYTPSVGSYPWNVGSGVEELNGTYDMMGNVWEWMENPWSDPNYGTGSTRVRRGGSCSSNVVNIESSYRYSVNPSSENADYGFRVASEVPEPFTFSLLALGGLALIHRRGS